MTHDTRQADESRRTLLKRAGVSALALAAGARVWAQPAAPAAGAPRLVVVLLRGAVDGLSVVAPFGEGGYRERRPTLALAAPGSTSADAALALDGRFGLHPALSPLVPYWNRGELAFVHACGSPDPTRSHFDAQDHLETATPGTKRTPDGWLNRLAVELGGAGRSTADQRLRALAVGPTVPRILGGDATVASLALGSTAVAPGVLEQPRVADAFARVYAGADAGSVALREAVATRHEILQALRSDDPSADAGALSLVGLARDAARLGQLMARDARVRLACLPVGGWDTHANQGAGQGALAQRLERLGQAVDALARALGERLAETHIMVLSEFGRTVAQNGTGGTDHGHGNVAWLLGGGVRGGRVHGAWPGLDRSALFEGRDLAVTTDFRALLAEQFERRFGMHDAALTRLLPGYAGARSSGALG